MSEDLFKDGKRIKDRSGKPRWELLDLDIIEQVVKVLTYGAEKYSAASWKDVPADEYYAAMMRHISKSRSGYSADEESGLSHLAHAMCDLYFLMWFDRNGAKDE